MRIAWDFGTCYVTEAKALTLKETIHVVISMQMEHIIFESDSYMMVQVIHTNNEGNSEFSVIISCIKNLLVCHSNFEVKFMKCQVNHVAHLLD